MTAILLPLAFAGIASAAPRIVAAEPDATTVPRCSRLEVTVRLAEEYADPYDPAVVAVEGRFLAPSGREIVMPGFWCLPYRNASEGGETFTNPGSERWERAGEPCFKVRFAPTETGTWRYRILARDATGETQSAEATFECVPSEARGFIRVSERNARAFAFDDGSAFVPLGMCIAWARRNGPGDTYDAYFRKLAENGCNAVRVWMCHWAWLEWTQGEAGSLAGYEGVGRYNQMVAANFDNLVQLAERHGLHLMLCLNNGAWEFGRPDGKNAEYDSWGGNPYNAANGGPCAQADDFWTSPEAKALYQRKLRYIIARWSYSPSVWSWEFWNEIGQESPATVAWHREMTATVHRTDPYRRPVSTSSWVQTAESNRETFAVLDYSQLHYGSADAITQMLATCEGKPLVIGEGTADEEGVEFHNSLWRSLMAGAAGPPLTWHDGPQSPVETHDRYGQFRAIAEFLRGENLAAGTYTPVRLRATASDTSLGAAQRYAPVVLRPLFSPWAEKAPQGEFVVPPDGIVNTRGLGTKLYGTNADRAIYANPPTFVLDCPVETDFVVTTGECSGPATVEIRVDGAPVTRHELPGTGRRYVPEADSRTVAHVPAGQHRVQVLNAGADWIEVLSFVVAAYRDRNVYPDLAVYALQATDRALVWAQNASHTPEVLSLGVRTEPVPGTSVELRGLRDGEYRIELWDTNAGTHADFGAVMCKGGVLSLRLPEVATDVAVKVLP
ncbi:MAG: DUF5060 domain-containing protein [Armatimonadetes bacterium]|nr:DUF5060 domain-containing protein [Armatimonadota bacterium]